MQKWKYFKFIKKCKNGNTLSSSKNIIKSDIVDTL